jgi:cell division transport system permease protein
MNKPQNRRIKPAEPKSVPAPAVGASLSSTTTGQKLRAWLASHRLECKQSLVRLLSIPGSSAMTWLVIGIALALPAGMYVALDNMERVSAGWDGTARVSLFLSEQVSRKDGQDLAESLLLDKSIEQTEYISSENALAEFKAISGFGEALDSLNENPLPAVIVVRPDDDVVDAVRTSALLEKLENLPQVDMAQLDMEWVQRLYALMELARRAIYALAALLALGVLLITGNTIRLAIENRRDEIVVTKLVGATNAFVRRPFLYTGWWYGLGGGLVAWLIVQVVLLLLSGPVVELVGLYEGSFALSGPNLAETLGLWFGGAVLGWAGAWLAVARHLGDIEPK